MKSKSFFSKKYLFSAIFLSFFSGIFTLLRANDLRPQQETNTLLGPRVNLKSDWIGKGDVPKNLSILLMAGHADSQGIYGSGTAGEAVDVRNERPMDSSISDELFWNIRICFAIERLGKNRGLNIKTYIPNQRTVHDGNDPITNWSVGALHARKGGYPIEVHFDSYGEYGFGSGLIPALTTSLNNVDESLAKTFGRYPLFFRGGLGGPKRLIRILEVGKLGGKLEEKLRSSNSREKTIELIATQIVDALVVGVNGKNI